MITPYVYYNGDKMQMVYPQYNVVSLSENNIQNILDLTTYKNETFDTNTFLSKALQRGITFPSSVASF